MRPFASELPWMDLFADRTFAGTMKANQLRLWFASMAYVLLEVVQQRLDAIPVAGVSELSKRAWCCGGAICRERTCRVRQNVP
jgi:hypothetical protein